MPVPSYSSERASRQPRHYCQVVKLRYYPHPGKWPPLESQARSVSKIPTTRDLKWITGIPYTLKARLGDSGFVVSGYSGTLVSRLRGSVMFSGSRSIFQVAQTALCEHISANGHSVFARQLGKAHVRYQRPGWE
jgi:hypothetical protein